MSETKLREEIVLLGKSMYDRGLTHGGTGNISARVDDGWLLTPTGSSLGRLDPARLSKLDWSGRHISGDKPSKEALLHLAMYEERPTSGAVVHLHSTHSVAVSVLDGLDPEDLLPAITAYYAMRVGKLPLVPYYAPGDPALADAVRSFSGKHHAMLLAHHGPVVAGSDLSAAVDATEELEATAQLFLLIFQHKFKTLTPQQIEDLQRRHPQR
ncbi:3-oxo-tetronate 4-phosphate decarboxylase [Pseudomonas rhizosphaerae]|uniref:3-oxo-tetronate 4-phosphate decarboxylase n=1 Tax=Pseudomonas rhizosphaerae TaxID=216142 RepID=UPI002B47418B|nr:3-oxo-tetronate 4-phosphate decarboxylase [Pseudomonas rhizosphaerae]MEB2870136.1 3-oxo-tetronate 4-phosphate decarboxylase [Pseudomonas rhizosphaerae]